MTLRWLWSSDRKIRFRLQQWTLTFAIYVASAVVLAFGASHGLVAHRSLAGWCVFVFTGLTIIYVILRSGISSLYRDPALTAWQITFGVSTVLWGYTMCGDVRSATLSALMVVLMFGAFSLRWQMMVRLTAASILALGLTIAGMHWYWPGGFDARVDVANFVIVSIMLPATCALAVLLGNLRARVHAHRSELALALARIQELASHDPLTGLTNRRLAQHLLELERQRSDRAGSHFSVAIVDLDHFKDINDRHGHGAGDLTLCGFAAEALATMRACDTVSRWGGEEFLLLLPDTEAACASAAIERLRARVEDLRVSTESGEVSVTLSAGVVGALPGEAVAATVARADRAMYAAKAAGRNRVVTG